MKIIIVIILFSSSFLYSQFSQQWVARYNGPANSYEAAADILSDNDGNIYVAGSTYNTNYDYVLIKYNPVGTIIWVKQYNGTGNSSDFISAMNLDNSGNIIVTGRSIGVGSALEDCVTIKYDSDGNVLWVQRYNGGNIDVGNELTIDQNDNIYVCGSKYRAAGNPDYLVIKYQPNGTIEWLQTYNSIDNKEDYGKDIKVDQYGNVFVTGSSYTTPDFDYLTVKYSSAGVYKWEKRYHGGNGDDYSNSLAVDGDSNIYITGKSKGTGTNFDIMTINYSSDGVAKWQTRTNGGANSNDEGNVITLDLNGNIIVAGYLYYLFSKEDMAVIKYNPDGNILWTYTYAGSTTRDDRLFYIFADSEGNIFVSGSSDSTNISDCISFRLDPEGNQQWLHNYNGPANNDDSPAGITIDVKGYTYILCTSVGIGTGFDIATIKLAQTIGINPVSNEVPTDFSLGQNYPNPLNPVSRIRFSVKNSSGVKIELFDAKGSSSGILVNEHLPAGIYETDVNAGMLSSGVYFYRMTADDFSATKKMIIIK